MKLVLLIGLLVCSGPRQGHSADDPSSAWGYNRNQTFKSPQFWNTLPEGSCGGMRQSPINIVPRNTRYNMSLKPIILRSQNFLARPVSLIKHYSLYLNFNPHWQIKFGFERCLTPLTIHWHWGSDQSKGSEHLLDGTQFPMEAHVVSYNCEKYNSSTQAVSSPDGLYVIAFFYRIGETNEVLQRVINTIDPLIKNERDTISVDEISPRLFMPANLYNYYRYEGSLTTPPCTENVIWTILNDVQQISLEQISAFRKLTFPDPESGPLVNNFRPLRTVPGSPDFINRVVYTSFNNGLVILWNMKLCGCLLLLQSLW